MKDYLKNITTRDALFIIAGAALIFALYYACNNEPQINKDAGIVKVKETPVTHYQDKKGTDHAEKPVAVANSKTINIFYEHIIDSLTKVIHAKNKDIEAIASISVSSGNEIHPQIIYKTIDTCLKKFPDLVHYKDDWITLDGSITKNVFQYSIRDSLTLVAYNHKKNLFAKKELILNAFSQNPHTTISGITAIKIDQAKPMKFGIGIQAGYSWNGSSFQPTIGIGLSYNLIRF